MNFKEEYQKKVIQIEQILKQYLPEKEGKQALIMEAMEYSLMAGGKRLRPMLMWETSSLSTLPPTRYRLMASLSTSRSWSIRC